MSQNPTDEYAKLLQKYHDLAAGVRVIRRAAERAFRNGALPPIERIGVTPVEECEAIARAIYAAAAAAAKQHENTRSRPRLVPSEQETGMIGHR
jgi:hypothetical protein